MSEARIRKGAAGFVTLVVVSLLLLAWRPGQELTSGPAKKVKPEQRPPGKPVQFSGNLATVAVSLGLRDTKGKAWDGQVSLSKGKILSVEIERGNAKASVKDNRFFVRSLFPKKKKKKKGVTRPALQISVNAPAGAKLTVTTKQGEFTVALDELVAGKSQYFLEKQAKAERRLGALRLTDPETEDDYAALANAPDGKVWLVYSEYQMGKPYLMERVLRGEFDELIPNGNGDQIRMKVFDGKTWSPCINVTDTGRDIWRPKVTVDKKNNVHVAWAEQVDGNWDIYYRVYHAGEKGNERVWSKTRRLSSHEGTDFNVAMATDAKGQVWTAWQAWRDGKFQIVVAPITDDAKIEGIHLTKAKANHWCPTMSADSKGNVYVAYDTYEKGNYDVRLAKLANKNGNVQIKTITVADSARFEARPFVLCDNQDRVWVAYELGDEQWGKDYSTNNFRKIGFDENPGYALYINRTVVVRCVDDGKVKQPKGSLEEALKGTLNRNRSLPRLAMDAEGGLWLFVRHHPLSGGAGEVWTSWSTRYDGNKWSTPQMIPQSRNILDKRPDYVPYESGVLTVYSGDGRTRTNDRQQADLFAAILPAASKAKPFTLVATEPKPKPIMKPVHPNETADIKRIRDYRIEHKGKKLRLYRGEFHRHTEYTAHRDQDGLLEDAWRYALDAGNMDWMGDGDHDNGYHHEFMWWQIQKVTDLFHHPPAFTAVQSYERSNRFPNGHRNAIMPRRGIRPLPRGNLQGDQLKGTPDTKLFYAYLRHFGGICASHTSGTNMGTDWRDNDPLVEPIVEIYQGHRHNYEHFGAPRAATQKTNIGGYQPTGFVWNAFAKGYKLGFQASSDHVSTHMSYAVVLTDDVSRQGLIDAFKRRHCYAATDNIIMEVRSGEHLMGDIFTTNKRPTLQITVKGTAPITKLFVVRNNKYVYSSEPNKKEVNLKYTDAEIKLGTEAFYYVRIEQRDANLAWSSPMWITYKE